MVRNVKKHSKMMKEWYSIFIRATLYNIPPFFTKNSKDERRYEKILFQHSFNTEVKPSQKKVFQKSFFLDPQLNLILSTKSRIVTCNYLVIVKTIVQNPYTGLKNISKIFVTKQPDAENSQVEFQHENLWGKCNKKIQMPPFTVETDDVMICIQEHARG